MARALALLAIATLLPANAGPAPFARPAVAPEQLAAMRGGFTLPGGIDVALAVRSETLLNGATLLLSEYRIDRGAPQLAVFVARSPEAGGADANGTGPAAPPAMPTLDYRDQTLVVTPAGPVLAVALGSGNAAPAEGRADLMQVSLADGASVATPAGQVSLAGETLRQVRLQGDLLDTTHFYGSALGSLTINTGSDRVIDTIVSVDIDLANVTPELMGSALMRVEGLGLAATAGLATQGGF